MPLRDTIVFGILTVTLGMVMAVILVPVATCDDGCGVDCGACLHCPAAAVLGPHEPLAAPLASVEKVIATPPLAPALPAAQLIEHVPLPAFV
jgi:hypothetical protein